MRQDGLEDVPNEFIKLENLNVFVRDAPWINVVPEKVTDIPSDNSFEKTHEKIEKELIQLRQEYYEEKRRYDQLVIEGKVETLICQFLFFFFFPMNYISINA